MTKPLWIFTLLALLALQGYSGLITGNLSGEPEALEQKILLTGGESLDLDEVLRFHVVAHSDEARDQEIKEEVTREVLAFVADRLQETESREQAKQALIDEIPLVQERVEQVLQAAGTPHPVKINLQREMFPPRQYLYGEFPAGEYEALRIVIGSGAGQNWWCVLFPPLCFSHAPEEKKEEPREEAVLDTGCTEDSGTDSSTPILAEDSCTGSTENPKEEVEVRFRVVEWVSNFLPSYYGLGRR